MAQQEADWKHASIGKRGVVAASGHQVDGCVGSLPAFHLQAIEALTGLIMDKGLSNIIARSETVVRGPEVQHREIDRVVPGSVNDRDGGRQGAVSPRTFTELICVMMDEPIGLEFAGRVLPCA